jgi:hypothetical protein
VTRRSAALALCAALAAGCAGPVQAPALQTLRRFAAPAAGQGVAVTDAAVYAVDTRAIEKYSPTGSLLLRYDAGDDAAIVHLNGCSAHAGVLYCAHSNYPGLPMRSSIERFDAETLAHIGSQPLDGAPGSATWVDRAGQRWLVAFAHYAGRGGEPGRGPEHSRLVAYDTDWRPLASYRYPAELVARFAGRSNSGGIVAGERLLLLTGHDASELYAACIDESAEVLRWTETWPAPFAGQGIALDAEHGSLWGVVRATRELVQVRAPVAQACP